MARDATRSLNLSRERTSAGWTGGTFHVRDGVRDDFGAVERQVVPFTVDHIQLVRVAAGALERGGDVGGGGYGVVRANQESDRCGDGNKIIFEPMLDDDPLEGS